MAWKLTEAYVGLGAPLGKLNADLKKAEGSVFKSVKRMADTARNIGIKMSIGGAAITGVSALLAKFAMTAEETENLFEVSMAKMAEQARAWSESLASSLGLNRIEVQKMLGIFNVMFKSMGEGAAGAFNMSKQLTALAFDMASFYNMAPELAFEKLQAGITGELEPLKRLGILLNESTLKTKALTMGITEQWSEVSELTKVHVRLASILDQTKAAQGDLARTSDSATNQLRSFKSLLEEIAITLGKALLPSLKIVLTKAREVAKSFLEWSRSNQALLQVLLPLVSAIGALGITLGPLLVALPILLTVFKGLGTVFLAMQSPLALVVLALAAIGALVIPWDKVKDGLAKMVTPADDAATSVASISTEAEDLNPVIANMGKVGKVGFDGINAAASGVADNLAEINIRTGKYARNAKDAGEKAAQSFWTVKPAVESISNVFDIVGPRAKFAGDQMKGAGVAGKQAGEDAAGGWLESKEAMALMNTESQTAEQGLALMETAMGKYKVKVDEAAGASTSWAETHKVALDKIKAFTFTTLKATVLAKMEFDEQMAESAKSALGSIVEFLAQDWTQKWRDAWDVIFGIVDTLIERNKTAFNHLVDSNIEAIGRLQAFFQSLSSLLPGGRRNRNSFDSPGPGGFFGSGESAGMAPQSTTNMGGVTINVVQREGEDQEALVRKISDAISIANRTGLINSNTALPGR